LFRREYGDIGEMVEEGDGEMPVEVRNEFLGAVSRSS
jgi:hypothetical protein